MKIKLKLACGFFSYIVTNTMVFAIDCTNESQTFSRFKTI